MNRQKLIFMVIVCCLFFWFLIGIRKWNFDFSEGSILSGQSFHDYSLTGNFLLKNHQERIQFSWNFVNYNGDLSFVASDFAEFSYENTPLNHYLAFFSSDQKRRLMLYKNQPAWLKDLCESGQLFDSEAPDFVLTGIEKKKGLDFMHVSMKFNQEQQEQYCFSLHQDYYLLQFTNMPQQKIDWFFRGLEIVR